MAVPPNDACEFRGAAPSGCGGARQLHGARWPRRDDLGPGTEVGNPTNAAPRTRGGKSLFSATSRARSAAVPKRIGAAHPFAEVARDQVAQCGACGCALRPAVPAATGTRPNAALWAATHGRTLPVHRIREHGFLEAAGLVLSVEQGQRLRI